MWSEEHENIDNRIRKAADSLPPQFADKHWEAMEALLDEHLPVEKKRRRFLFILLFTALFTGAGIVTTMQLTKKEAISEQNTAHPANTTPSIPETKKSNRKIEQPSEINTPIEAPVQTEANIDDKKKNEVILTTNSNRSVQFSTKKNKKDSRIKYIVTADNKIIKSNTSRSAEKEINNNNSFSTTQDISSIINDKSTTIEKTDSNSAGNNITAIDNPATPETAEAKTDSSSSPDISQQEKPSSSKNKQSKFSILLSAGTDISGIGTKAGTPQIAYGIGVGYSLSDRWTIRTGVLAAVKKYDAKPEQYRPDNYSFWSYYPNMQKIDADCFVYEIPVSVLYQFKTANKHNWFLSAGLSSFIMKRETYDYTYKDTWGQTRYSSHTYENEYKHWFSVVSISGGYQYQFNQKFSLLAEPYIKMPLAGVGFGHVKLNSAGVLVTAAVKPFTKNKQ